MTRRRNPAGYARARVKVQKTPLDMALSIARSKPASFLLKHPGALFKSKLVTSEFLPTPFPQSIDELNEPRADTYSFGVEKDVVIIGHLLNKYATEINCFLKLEEKFSRHYLLGQYQNALEVVDELDSQIGYSYWSVQNRLNLIQLTEGLDQQKSYVEKLRNQGMTSQISYLTGCLSFKAEETTSFQNFKSQSESTIEKLRFPRGFKSYLLYKLGLKRVVDYDDMWAHFAYDLDGAVVDLYLTYLSLVQSLIVQDKDKAQTARGIISLLSDSIDDFRLRSISRALGDHVDLNSEVNVKSTNEIVELYTKGDYVAARNKAEEFLLVNPEYISIIEIYCKSAIRTNHAVMNESWLGVICQEITNMILKSTDAFSSYHVLMKLCALNHLSSWSAELQSLLLREAFDQRNSGDFEYKYGYLNTKANTPVVSEVYRDEKIVDAYLEDIATVIDSRSTVDLYRSRRFGAALEAATSIEIPTYRINKFKGDRALYYDRDFQNAQKYYSLAYAEGDDIAKNAILGKLVLCDLMNEDNAGAITRLVDSYLANNNIYTSLPILTVINRMESSSDWPDLIETPIIFEIYNKHYSDEKKLPALRWSYEKYLLDNEFSKPSDMFAIKSLSLKERYYLRYVCVPEYMKHAICWNTSREIDEERVRICNHLLDVDPENAEDYLAEKTNITQKLLVGESIKHVDESKVYVNVVALKNSTIKTLEGNYLRFKSLKVSADDEKAEGMAKLLDTINRMLSETLEAKGKKVDALYLSNNLPSSKNEKNWVFIENLVKIRDEFVFGDYGLNGYLSTRVRHGTLLNTLRSPVYEEHLVTLKNEGKNDYLDNTYWKDKLYSLSPSELEEALGHLKVFTQEYDDLISSIGDVWLQVDTSSLPSEDRSEKLFNFSITDLQVRELQKVIPQDASFDEYFDILIEWLWARTESCLKIIRTKLSSEAKDSFNELFGDLQIKLGESGIHDAELSSSIVRARNSVQLQIDNVVSWFERRKSEDVRDIQLTLDIPIKVAARITSPYKSEGKSFDPNISVTENIEMRGTHLTSFVDIFSTLFDNSLKYSGFTSGYPVIDANVEIVDSKICISVKNECVLKEDIEDANKEVDMLLESIDVSGFKSGIGYEGKSGFKKIVKTITKDLSSNLQEFRAYYESKERFVVYLSFDKEGLV